MALSMAGGGLGFIVFPVLFAALLEVYGTRGTLLLCSSLYLNGIVCGAVYRQIQKPSVRNGIVIICMYHTNRSSYNECLRSWSIIRSVFKIFFRRPNNNDGNKEGGLGQGIFSISPFNIFNSNTPDVWPLRHSPFPVSPFEGHTHGLLIRTVRHVDFGHWFYKSSRKSRDRDSDREFSAQTIRVFHHGIYSLFSINGVLCLC